MAFSILSPLQGVYTITTNFWDKVILGPRTGQQHNALDYATPIGTPIYAVTDARVTRADNTDPWGGNIIRLDSGFDRTGNSYFTAIYAHLDKMYVTPGESVKAGQLIGTTGNTGEATTGPHLYFETRILGKPVDPNTLISGQPSGTTQQSFMTKDPVNGQCQSGWVLGQDIQNVLFEQFGTLPIFGGIIGWATGTQFDSHKCYNRTQVSTSAFQAAQAAGNNPVSNTVGAIGDAAFTIGIIFLAAAIIIAGVLLLRDNK